MAIAFVQGIGGFVNPNTVLTLTWPAPTTAGNLAVINVLLTTATTTAVATDSAGNTYAATTSSPFDSLTRRSYQFYGIQTGSATTFTITISVSGVCFAVGHEYSGCASSSPFDKDSTGTGIASTSVAVTSFTPTADGSLVVAGVVPLGGSALTAGTNYTLGGTANNTALATEYRLSSSGAETAPGTLAGSSNWNELAGCYLAASGAVIMRARNAIITAAVRRAVTR